MPTMTKREARLLKKTILRMGGAVLTASVVAACGGGTDSPRPTAAAVAASAADTVVVYKTPTCGCCDKWVDHVKEHGFPVVTHDLDRLDHIRQTLGVPAGMISCHTATVRGYTIEGHVPADLIRRIIDEGAPIRGLTVPGMPVGSPGMEGPWKQDYDVLAFDDRGNIRVYARR
jgi:hypothetical protein